MWFAAVLLLLSGVAVEAQTSSPVGFVHPGQPVNCNGWHTVVSGDTCASVHTRYGISMTMFRAYNPAVSADCTQNFWLEAAYCVRLGPRVATTTTTTTTTTAISSSVPTVSPPSNGPETSPAGPVHPGQPANCNGWHTVVSGDTCRSVHTRYDISMTIFRAFNPAISADCTQNFWIGSSYCVRVGPRVTTTTAPPPTGVTTVPPSLSSTWFNSTYSAQHPVTEWNITASSRDTAWPPTKTITGQTALCNEWHLVSPGDTCKSVVDRYGLLTREKLLAWNLNIEDDCEELLADYWLCVGAVNRVANTDLEWETPQPDFTPPPAPTEHTVVTPAPADSIFTPSPSHGPMPANCRVFHRAEADQNCAAVLAIYGYVSRQQFFQWNPVLAGNCNGLWLDTWYCVGAFDELPLPAHQTSKPSSGNVPLGFPQDCTRWYRTTVADTCAGIAAMFGSFGEDDFIRWNPTVAGSCVAIKQDAWYCVGRPATPTTRTGGALEPTSPGGSGARPTQSGIAADCAEYWLVGPEDTCGGIAHGADISLDDLYLWNGALRTPACDGLEADYYVCVGTGGDDEQEPPTTATTRSSSTTATRTSRPTTTQAAPVETPQPVREGMVEGCVRFYLQQPGDLCYSMANRAGISLAQFYEWNPAVGSECFNLWPDYYYCIGVGGSATTISQGPPVPT